MLIEKVQEVVVIPSIADVYWQQLSNFFSILSFGRSGRGTQVNVDGFQMEPCGQHPAVRPAVRSHCDFGTHVLGLPVIH